MTMLHEQREWVTVGFGRVLTAERFLDDRNHLDRVHQ
jgi:hypothetical protein